MSICDIICQPLLKNDKKLKKICEPLSQSFGLDTFWYYTLTDQGELSYIGNNLHVAEYFFSNKLYDGHPYFKHTSLLKSGFFFSDKTKENDYIITQGKLRDLTQIFVTMNVIDGKVHGYGFATTLHLPDL